MYEYKTIPEMETSLELFTPRKLIQMANHEAKDGWQVKHVFPDGMLLLERINPRWAEKQFEKAIELELSNHKAWNGY